MSHCLVLTIADFPVSAIQSFLYILIGSVPVLLA